jgi:regulator of protease activity HflC (stomatin/prohibitin superfamily)
MHSGMRSNIEAQIKAKMGDVLKQRIIVESVLMKSIQLPVGLASSVERKLQAEQDAMRMEFVLQQEKNSKQKGKLLKQKEQEILKNSSRRSIMILLNYDLLRLF